MIRLALLAGLVAGIPTAASGADCSAPLDFLKTGLSSLAQCRQKAANPFATSACLDVQELPAREREGHCKALDRELRSIAADHSLERLRRSIERTASIAATIGFNLVRLDFQDGSFNPELTATVLGFNIGPDGVIAALATPQAFWQFGSYRRPNGVPEPDIAKLLTHGGNRFAYVEKEKTDTAGRRWSWAALLLIEADKQPKRYVRLDLAGRFDASRVGDVNPSGILIESWYEKPAGKDERL